MAIDNEYKQRAAHWAATEMTKEDGLTLVDAQGKNIATRAADAPKPDAQYVYALSERITADGDLQRQALEAYKKAGEPAEGREHSTPRSVNTTGMYR